MGSGRRRALGKSPVQQRELSQLRLILFSDLHKGKRTHRGKPDRADDFLPCELVYLAALDHYWQAGFELFLVGDVEELLKESPGPVIEAYKNVLDVEKQFAKAQRYARFVGNHDEMWYDATEVQTHLGDYLAGARIMEGLRLEVNDRGQRLGELFIVHGHQGTLDADRWHHLTAPLVRCIVRPLQRLFDFPSSTPSNNFRLRRKHEKAMYAYAKSRPGQVLIAGHTHHPVWIGMGMRETLMDLATMHTQSLGVRPPRSIKQAIASYQKVLQAEAAQPVPVDLRWIQKQVRESIDLGGEKPCYFNSGCCSYRDHALITGLEIADEEIRLVMWHKPKSPQRMEVFPPEKLRDVLANANRT